jgi:hypothetical protein
LLKQFDIVRILSVKGIQFMSGPPGKPTDPNGYWSVVGFLGSDIIIAKDQTIVRAPLSAVSKVASYERNITKRESQHGKI